MDEDSHDLVHTGTPVDCSVYEEPHDLVHTGTPVGCSVYEEHHHPRLISFRSLAEVMASLRPTSPHTPDSFLVSVS